MTDHLSTFLDAVFRNCTSDGGVHLYAFKHDDSRKASENLRVARTDLTTMRAMIDRVARARNPSQVFSPPVCLFGPSPRTVTTNVLEAPVIALELDDHPGESRALAEAVLGPATLVIKSGGVTPDGEDKLHLYWRLTQPARTSDEQATLRAVRMQLIALTGGDSTGGPIVHPMRWPGSWHTKGEPRLCVIAEHTDREISLQEAVDAMALVGDLPNVRPVTPREGWKTSVALTAEELARLASAMPNVGLTWDEWNKTGMAFFDASHGSEDGLAAFHAWSEKDHRYSEGETEARWYHWHNSPPSMLGAGTLYHTAGEVQPRERPSGEDMFPDDEPRATPPRLEPPTVTRARTFGYGLRDGGIMHIDQQFEHFKGCIYVSSLDRVLMPDGSELNQSRFDNIMGGYSFIYTEDGKVTKSAWEALLKNQRYSAPWAHHVCFRPELPPLTLTEDGTWVLVNTFIPIDTPTLDADPTPFLNHMMKLFPDERDRAIILNFMASVIQNPGFKAQWWPVIQGAKGNGKTLLLNIMAFAVGEQYSHLPNTGKMTRSGINFNGWMKGKLFLGIDEIYSANRRDFLEEFKPYVTNRRLPIESKGVDEYTGDNRANGIMLTNHQDGVPIDKDERRYAPLFTAQQTAEDCIRDGLTSEYFQDLWAWFRGEGVYAVHGPDYGFRIVNHYLRTFKTDPQLDPAQFATRAPRTSSTEQAILAGRGRVEQEILEAIEQGQPGFAGGWISSIMLYKMFDAKRISFPRNKCRDMLKHLGYIPHPGLKDGRTNDMVQPDGGKPRLFVLTDHPSINYGSGSEIAKKYTEDQIAQILGA
jgi:hypothetical protein